MILRAPAPVDPPASEGVSGGDLEVGTSRETYFLPANRRLLVGFIVVGCLVEAMFTLLNLALHINPSISLAHALGLIANYLFLRKTGSFFWSAQLFLLMMLAVYVANVVAFGGIYSPTISWMPVYCIGTFLLMGKKWGAIWALVAIAVVNTSAFLPLGGGLPKPVLHQAQYFYTVLLNNLIVSATVAGLSLAFAISRDRVIQRQIEEKAQVDRLLADKRALVSTICHDIANPLTAIGAYADLARLSLEGGAGNAPPAEMLGNLRSIEEGCAQVNEIISQVREMQVIELGKKMLTLEPVDLGVALRSLQVMFDRQLRAKALSLEIQAEEVSVQADRAALLNHVLANLLSNAIKFSERGAAITLGVTREGEKVLISIQDRGIGIPPAVLPHLFEETSKTSRPGTEGERGSGLGLPLVKRYLELFGGAIEIRSAEVPSEGRPRGTTVRVRLKHADPAQGR